MVNAPLIAICVPTYKRPVYLSGLLESLAATVVDGFLIELIVADNDEARSAEAVVNAAAKELPFPVNYVVETKRGVASARNRLVREAARLTAEYVAFVDDDQFVEPDWLFQLYRTAVSTKADAVRGRYVFYFEDDVPEWARKFRRSATQGAVTGTPVRYFGTGNVLINLGAMLQIPGPFDERLNLSGGEDSIFSEQFRLAGFTAIQCAESVVYERVSRDRATAVWRIRRGYRSGIVSAQVSTLVEPNPRKIAVRATKSAVAILVHTINLILDFPRGRGAVVSRLASISAGVGGLIGLTRGSKGYEEYRSTFGR